MTKQNNISKEEQIRRFKAFKKNFYKGVRERYEKKSRARENHDSESISIIHGTIPRDQVLRKNRVIKPKN